MTSPAPGTLAAVLESQELNAVESGDQWGDLDRIRSWSRPVKS